MSIGDRNPLLISSYEDIPKEATLVKFSQSRFVRNFLLRRCFRMWKLECTRLLYNQRRKMLLENLL